MSVLMAGCQQTLGPSDARRETPRNGKRKRLPIEAGKAQGALHVSKWVHKWV
jgi:hypothetical protein